MSPDRVSGTAGDCEVEYNFLWIRSTDQRSTPACFHLLSTAAAAASKMMLPAEQKAENRDSGGL